MGTHSTNLLLWHPQKFRPSKIVHLSLFYFAHVPWAGNLRGEDRGEDGGNRGGDRQKTANGG